MRSRFDEQLTKLKREIIEMGALCETVIAISSKALTDSDISLAKQEAQKHSFRKALRPQNDYRHETNW